MAGHDRFSRAGASIVVTPDGAWVYDPTSARRLQALDDGDVLEDSFRYRASDGTKERWAVVEGPVERSGFESARLGGRNRTRTRADAPISPDE